MKKLVFNLVKTAKRHGTIVRNFSYLSILQVFNLLLPLLTYPYLIRVLGGSTYGLVVFAQAIIGYLVILVSFGFNVSATRDISVNRDDKIKLDEIVSSILTIKTILCLFAFAVLCGLLYFIPKAHGYETLFVVSMWACIYDVIFPTWYFQGIEQMKYITYITLSSRLIFAGLIFIFIKSPTDYLLFPIISGVGCLIAGLIALYIIFGKHRIQFKFQPVKILKSYSVDSVPLFISNVSISLYVSTNKVIVGSFLGMGEVAYYDLAEKITSILRMPQSILSQALFPKISKDKNLEFIKTIFKTSLVLNIGIYVLLLMSSKYIILILGGELMLPSQLVVNTLALTIPITAMSNIFGMQVLIPFGKNKIFSKVILSSGLIYLLQIGMLWITIGFSVISVSIITVNTEIFVTLFMYFYCKKLKLWK